LKEPFFPEEPGDISALAVNLTLSFDRPLVWEIVKCVSSQWRRRARVGRSRIFGRGHCARITSGKAAKQKHNRAWSKKDEGTLRKMLAETAKASTP
jgi:hypothetical protein